MYKILVFGGEGVIKWHLVAALILFIFPALKHQQDSVWDWGSDMKVPDMSRKICSLMGKAQFFIKPYLF